MKLSQYTIQKGFTIIETLVAVTLLMIAIAGPLLIASKGLTSALYAKDQMTASYLAQEAMETIKNWKSNADSGDSEGSLFGSFVSALNASCDESRRCDFNPNNLPTGLRFCPAGGELCPLYIDDNSIYSSNDSGKNTVFKRGFYLEKASAPPAPGFPSSSVPCINSDQECRVHVTVSWNTTTVENEVDLYLNLTQQQTSK